ncbi:MAG: FAD-dependent oxidoreductase [Microcystaceae cyanobacterium]
MTTLTETYFSQLPNNPLIGLRKADELWSNYRQGNIPTPTVVNTESNNLNSCQWDIIISGGTLGILLATALKLKGWNVLLIERGILKGREQEWNISRQEINQLVELELLTIEELDQAIATEYNPARVSFHKGYELWVEDVLNIGVNPIYLLETLKQKFLKLGGTLLENTPFKSATVHPDGVKVKAGEAVYHTRLLIDAMGHFSPIIQQARQGKKPDGICLVVGSCAEGYKDNETGDLIASFTPILNQCQYFWEAFPAKDGRTTYLFTYLDAESERFSLEFFMEEYFRLLPEYQKIELNQLTFKRFLFGFFPSYQKSPIKLPWNRILPVGDSSGSQSPVSFGGFGAMIRHLKRLTLGIDEALKADCLDNNDIHLLQPYQPNISVTWLFQKTMSVEVNRNPNSQQINQLMSGVFEVMDRLGDDVLKPFLQDVIQFPALAKTLIQVHPKFVLPVLPQVGLSPLIDWTFHYGNLALYSLIYPVAKNLDAVVNGLPIKQQYYYHRWLDQMKYGSGKDYHG